MPPLQQDLHATLHVRLPAAPHICVIDPYSSHGCSVAPCGHTFDLECLQDAFLNAPPTPLDTRLQLRKVRTRQKLCPHPDCGVEVLVPPAPAWTVRSVAGTVAPVGKELPPVQEMEEDEPWVGIFDNYVIPRLGVLKAGGNGVPGIPA
jgi:hypothetical protein